MCTPKKNHRPSDTPIFRIASEHRFLRELEALIEDLVWE